VEENIMLSLRDCLDFCEVDSAEIEAIAEHQHLPFIVAAEMSNVLLSSPEGLSSLYRMVLDNLNQAVEHRDLERVMRNCLAYQHLQTTHPLPVC
jgi:hypothetical protein